MGTRTLGGTFISYESMSGGEIVAFDSDTYAGNAVTGGNVTGGTITFTNIRTYYSDFFFRIYVDGLQVCETVRIMDQNNDLHDLTVDIDMDFGLESSNLLSQSGTITVELFDNKDTGYNICRFEYGSTITINAIHDVSVVPYAPAVSQNNDGTLSISWSAARTTSGSGNIEYTLVYTEDGQTKDVGTSRSTTLTIAPSWYGSSIRFYVFASYSGVTGSSGYTYFTPETPSVSAPTMQTINGETSYTGVSAPLSWYASTSSHTTGAITYIIYFNGTQVATTTETEYEVPKSITKEYEKATITVTVTASCGGYSSGSSNSVYFTYNPGHSFVMYYINGGFVPCVPYYYTGGTWIECVPHYYTAGGWKECSS